MNLEKSKTLRILSLLVAVACIFAGATVSVGCENKPVVKEAMDEDAKKVPPNDVTSTNIDEPKDPGAENMPGMPDDTENVLPGAAE